MESKSLSSSVSGPQQASNQDEVFMQQSLLFSHTLKELKSLRQQLYSAAEYFETSYSNEDQKQLVVENLKDYAIKALVNTIDHLGSIAYKVNSFVDEKVSEVSALEIRVGCLQQRVGVCREYINQGGLSQHFLNVETPKYHKHYIFTPAETKSERHRRSFNAENNSDQFKNAVQAMIRGTPPSIFREGHCRLEAPQFCSSQGNFTFLRNSINKRPPDHRTPSPQIFPFTRSGSVLPKRSISPNDNHIRRNPTDIRRSVSLSKYAERKGANDIEQYSSKSKKLFKALLSMRKSKKDQSLYNYLDKV